MVSRIPTTSSFRPKQIVQKFFLFFTYVSSSFLYVEPATPVYFGDFDTFSRARRPLDLTGVTHQFCGIAITLKCPSSHDLPALLLDRPKIDELPGSLKAGLFFKLAPCRDKRILILLIFTLRKGPCALVLLGPDRPTRMNQKDL